MFLACCVLPDKKLYGNRLCWCKYIRDINGAMQRLKATVPDRKVWLPAHACVIIAVRLNKALKDAHGAPFPHERTNFYWICYFGSLIRFAHFMIMLGGEIPSLPPLTVRHWFFIIQIFEQLSCSEKHSCPEAFHYIEIFFIFQDFWATCGLPWKTEHALNSLYWIYIYLIIQNI